MADHTIGILSDSSADFPPGTAESLGIEIIPIHISIDGEDLLHGVDVSSREVVDALRQNREVKVSPPMPSEYVDRFESLVRRYTSVLSFHVSSELSNCYTSASSSKRILFDETAARITLVDTRTMSVGMGLVVKRAAALRKQTTDPAELLQRLEPLMENSLLLLTVDNLDWLKQAGKMNTISSLMGSFLNVKPVIRIREGRLAPLTRYRGKQPAVDEMIRLARQEHNRFGLRQDIWIAHADAAEDAARIRESLLDVSADMRSDVKLMEAGPSISTHTGPGCLCLGMMRR